jgi:hypothetical protein
MVAAMTKSSSACLDINRWLCCLLKAITKNFKVNPLLVYINGEIVASIPKSEVAESHKSVSFTSSPHHTSTRQSGGRRCWQSYWQCKAWAVGQSKAAQAGRCDCTRLEQQETKQWRWSNSNPMDEVVCVSLNCWAKSHRRQEATAEWACRWAHLLLYTTGKTLSWR